MGQGKDKMLRKAAREQVSRDNKAVYQGFMLEMSTKPFWQRFWFCMKMAFKQHRLQKSMKPQIAERKKLLKAAKIMDSGKAVTIEKGRTVGPTFGGHGLTKTKKPVHRFQIDAEKSGGK